MQNIDKYQLNNSCSPGGKKTILTWWSLASFHFNRINTSIFVLHLSVRKRHPRRLKLYKTSEMLYKEDGRKIPTPSIVKQEILSLILLVLLTDAETDLSNAPIDTFLPSYQIFLPPPLTYGWLSEVIEVRINISRPRCRPFHLALISLIENWTMPPCWNANDRRALKEHR